MTSGRKRWSTIEREMRDGNGDFLLAGVDEAGRGPIAGPVVACAVIMPSGRRAIAGVDDSKQLSREQRSRLYTLILGNALAVGLGAASTREVDRLNIYHATALAMTRAVRRLGVTPHSVLVDGLPVKVLPFPHKGIVGGDSRCYSIACASIVAKVTRDRLMRNLAARYPDYLWSRNAGYGTAAHFSAVKALGVTPHHRRTFLSGFLAEPELPR